MKNKDEFYMGIARQISLTSNCQRNKVGALLERDGNIISFGYNGTPRGFDNTCQLDSGITKPEVLHAESNAIAKCAQSTISSTDSILYVTVSPCFDCAKLIIQTGIREVVYDTPYRNEAGEYLLKKAGIVCRPI